MRQAIVPLSSARRRSFPVLAAAWAAAFAALVVVPTSAQSTQPTLIDINQEPGPPDDDSDPSQFTVVGGVAYFRARSVATGFELWSTDGTPAGTALVADLRPGPVGSEPDGLTVFQGAVYFAADDGQTGDELWMVAPNGTPQLVADLVPGPGSSSPASLTPAGNDLHFVATGAGGGAELYRLDGTTGVAQLVDDIRPGLLGSQPQELTPFRGGVLFSADDGVEGREPWFSDGTSAGTHLVRAIVAGSGGSVPVDFAVVGNTAWFSAADASHGRELWQTDGTLRTTVLVRDILAGASSSDPRALVALPVGRTTRIYFAADAPGVGRELHMYDLSAQSVSLVADLNSGLLGSSPEDLTPFLGRLAFSAMNPVTGQSGRQLWILDPAGGGTTWIDVFPAITYEDVSALTVSSSGRSATLFGLSGQGVFATDGTQAGTLHTNCGPQNLGPLPGERVAFANPTQIFGTEPFMVEATVSGLTMLGDLNPGAGTRDSEPVATAMSPAFGTGSDVAAAADDGVHGRELFVVDDATAQATLIDIRPGPEGSSPQNITRIGDQLWMSADDGVHGAEPWISSGTAGTATMVVDVRTGAEGSEPSGFVAFGGFVYFVVSNGISGVELWRTDATGQGTARIAVLVANPGLGMRTVWTSVVQGELFVTVRSALPSFAENKIWRTDGTLAGTTAVTLGHTEPPLPLGVVASRIVYYVHRVSFLTYDQEIRSFDVTNGNETLLSQVTASGDQFLAPAMVGSQFAVFFAGSRTGLEPWKTDGTVAGTGLIVDLRPGVSGSVPVTQSLQQVWGGSDRGYFPADDGANGVELWTTDGTAAGTVRLTQAGPGSADADIDRGNPVGNGTALAVTIGGNPWFSLGTPSTTFEIADLDPTDDRTHGFVTSGGSLYFAGEDEVHGLELWKVALADLGGSNAAAYGRGCSSSSAILLSAGSRAAIHSTLVLRASPVTPNATAVLLIGVGAASIPLNASCRLLTQPFLSPATMSRSNGVAAFSTPLTNDPSLVGAMVNCQVAAAAPGGAAYGVVDLSQGLQVVIGR